MQTPYNFAAGLVYYKAAETYSAFSWKHARLNYEKAQKAYCSIQQDNLCKHYTKIIEQKINSLKETLGEDNGK
tara:strand:+ start:83 stop:301 length:219 start_codon:yes stop_codon:yes gene_type:complete